MKKILFIYLKKTIWQTLSLLVLIPLFSYLTVRLSIQIKKIIDGFTTAEDISIKIMVFIMLSVGAFLINNIISIISQYIKTSLSIYLKKAALGRLFKYRTGDLKRENIVELWVKDINEFVECIFSIINPNIINISVGLFALYQLFRINLYFSIFSITLSILIIPLMKLFGKKIAAIARTQRESNKKLNNQILNFYKNRTLILNYGINMWVLNGLNELSEKISYDNSLFYLIGNFSRILQRIISSILPSGILIFSFILLTNNSISIGEVVASLTLITNVSTGIESLIDTYSKFKITEQRMKELNIFYEILFISNSRVRIPNDNHLDIKLENITYMREEKKILNHFSLNIQNGEKIAIVGESGSGKTTLVRMIMGMVKPTTGQVFINGIELEKIDLTSYWEKMIYISSNIYVRNGTLKSNLSINESKLDSEIANLGLEKLDRMIGPNHYNISGGEEKKLAFLRELNRKNDNHSLIILDEISTGLDNRSITTIFNYLEQMAATVILITHDKTLAQKMDKIIKIDHL